MTKKEFEQLINEQRAKGYTDEDIAKIFALMYRDRKIDRRTIEGILEGMGYELTDECKAMDDETFRKIILVPND